MKENLDNIPEIIKLAKNYGIQITFMPYNPVKNKNKEHGIIHSDSQEIRHVLTRFKREYPDVITNPFTTLSAVEYFLNSGGYGECDAGHSFLWVRPNGRLAACTDHPESEGLTLQEIKHFKDHNKCNNCYVPCRTLAETAKSQNPFTLFNLARELRSIIYQR